MIWRHDQGHGDIFDLPQRGQQMGRLKGTFHCAERTARGAWFWNLGLVFESVGDSCSASSSGAEVVWIMFTLMNSSRSVTCAASPLAVVTAQLCGYRNVKCPALSVNTQVGSLPSPGISDVVVPSSPPLKVGGEEVPQAANASRSS